MAYEKTSAVEKERWHTPQTFLSSYAPRLRQYANSLLTPVIQPTTILPQVRTTKRGTTAINYAEDGFEDEDEDSEARRPTGLRSLRRDDPATVKPQDKDVGKELTAPIEIQGIWRDWVGKTKRNLTEKQAQVQAQLPLTLIPIRIDMDIQPFRPEPALPPPNRSEFARVDESMAAYRQPDMTPTYRLKDAFLWNLHEALMTPDQFASTLVDELDLPKDRKPALISAIAAEIRKQLEKYAGIAMHPLFQQGSQTNTTNNTAPAPAVQPTGTSTPRFPRSFGLSRESSFTPMPFLPTGSGSLIPAQNGTSQPPSGAQTPALTNGNVAITNGNSTPAVNGDGKSAITATAARAPSSDTANDIYNPDDTYRCIITLSINLMNRLYTDKFEWSLIHPPGFPETFAKQTCADLGLAGEWVPAMTHAIYEAVLRLKEQACENGQLFGVDIDNEAAEDREAGWRYDHEDLGAEWEPKIELLSKEEIENRERDRERESRRARRENARFSTAGMAPTPQGDYFGGGDEERMGRGERSKKKRRFRSLSPVNRETPDFSAYGGGVPLQDFERPNWRCSNCRIWGSAVWAVRDGPLGPKTLCMNCGHLYEQSTREPKRLPPWNKDLFAFERPLGTR